MNGRLIGSALFFASILSTPATAQVDVGATPLVLASYQPVDDGYVGNPYLNEGIGGLGWGFGGALSVIFPNGFVFDADYTTARFGKEQFGRLVAGQNIPATTRLRDSLLSTLVGYAVNNGSTRTLFLGGVSTKLDRATVNGEEAGLGFTDETKTRFAPTGGIDVLKPLSSRVDLQITGRYTYNRRDEGLEQLGIGQHILRVGGGVRIRLN